MRKFAAVFILIVFSRPALARDRVEATPQQLMQFSAAANAFSSALVQQQQPYSYAASYPEMGDQQTEAGYSSGYYCANGPCDPGPRDYGLNSAAIQSAAGGSTGNVCTDKLLQAAHAEASCWDNHGAGNCQSPPSNYGNYQKGPRMGSCARGVASALTRAGISHGEAMGNAKDMGPALVSHGFQNMYTPGMTPDSAPVGAILIYGGAERSGCRGSGSTYGHVEIKDFGGMYLYDGEADKNIQATLGADCRPLIGVYLPVAVTCG